MIKEACVENLPQAIKAQVLGADRLELCSRLDMDGLTPDLTLFRQVRKAVAIPIHVMIRPEPAHSAFPFVLTDKDIRKVIYQVEQFRAVGADGFVFGALTETQDIDMRGLETISKYVEGMHLTFHKAIDLCTAPLLAAQRLEKEAAVTHILTSGGSSSATSGIDILRNMKKQLNRITVIVAGGVTAENLPYLHAQIQAKEYHGKRVVGDLNQE